MLVEKFIEFLLKIKHTPYCNPPKHLKKEEIWIINQRIPEDKLEEFLQKINDECAPKGYYYQLVER